MADINGTAGNDILNGTAGADRIDGGGGDDQLRGNGGDDILNGGEGNDFLRGGEGADTFDGGADNGVSGMFGSYGDRISFFEARATQGVIADLRTGIISNDGFGNVETMTGIESLGGDTAYADVFHGNDGINDLFGSRGDQLYGHGADDRIQVSAAAAAVDGGAGRDTLLLSNAGFQAPDTNGDGFAENIGPASAGWVINLTDGFMLDGYGSSGSVSSIEVVFGTELNDALIGGGGDDQLDGGAGHDLVEGRGGNDSLAGGEGDDLLRGGDGNDVIDGGNGIDRASFSIGATTGIRVDLNLAGIAQDTGQGFDTLIGIEHVSGTVFSDLITGDGGDNWISSGSDGSGSAVGDDILSGGAGNDLIEVGIGNHVLDGAVGNDTAKLYGNGTHISTAGVTASLALQGTAQDTGQGMMTLTGFENLSGSLHGDRLTGDNGANVLAGDAGDDVLNGGAGNDILYGDGRIGVDTRGTGRSGPIVTVESLADVGNDVLNGGEGDDRLVGGNGNDLLDGGTGADFMDGGAGDDIFYVDQHGDIVIEAPGGGTDEVRSAVNYGLGGIPDIENLTAVGTGDIFLGGNSGGNVLTGNSGDNYIVGEGANDSIDGRGGRDIASFQLPVGAVGDVILVEGTGADAGKLLVQLVHGGTAETFLKVTITGAGSAVVEGVGIGAFLGTDTVANIEELHAFVRAPDGSPASQVVNISLATQQFGEWLNGSPGDDVIDIAAYPGAINATGGLGDDTIIGTGAGNYLIGEGGDDAIDGLGGRDVASFQLPPGTTGDVIIVDGRGADAGKLLVQLVNGGVSQTFLKVTVTGSGSAVVEGVGIGAFMGTDNVANVEELHIFVRTADGSPTPPNQFANVNLTALQFGDYVAGSEGDDIIDLSAYPGAVNAGGNRGDDTIIGNAASNYMIGGAGDDTISGGTGAGYDVAAFQLPAGIAGSLRVVAGTGADIGTLIVDRVDGATVEAVFRVSLADDGTATVQGLGSAAHLGTDTVSNVDAIDFSSDRGFINMVIPVQGTPGNDFINGGGQANLIFGADGDDQLRGNGGDDVIRGGAGNDLLRGGTGIDHFDGGTDNGALSPLLGGYGDRISFFETAATQGVVADLRTGIIANDGFGNVERMSGIESLGGDTAFVDEFYGDDGVNALIASRGDRIYGFGGDDIIQLSAAGMADGGDGRDTLILTGFGGFLTPDSNGDGFAELVAPATAGWYVDLGFGFITDGYGNSGSITGIEVVFGSTLNDILLGGGNADELHGADGHDALRGWGGADRLFGGGGDDFLVGGAGDDLIDGGDGLDRASFSTGATRGITVDLNLAGIAQDTGQGMDTLIGIEHVTGTVFDDVITGDGADNWIGSGSDGSGSATGNDLLSGGGGNDLIDVGIGNHAMAGGDGIDTARLYGNGTHISAAGVTVSLALQGTAQDTEQGMMTLTGFENLSGSLHDDNLTGDDGANVLAGDAGNDVLNGGAGNDRLYGDGRIAVDTRGTGGSGPIVTIVDTAALGSSPGDDVLHGGDGDDVLDGGNGNDVLHGGIGADVLIGGFGSDRLFGGAGEDFLIDGLGNDTVDGGAGYDTAGLYFAPDTVGSFSTVAGTGADAGKTFVVRTYPGGSEQVAMIVTAGGVTTVTGLGSAAYLGTNTMIGVERLLISTVPPDPFANPVSPGYALFDLTAPLSGTVADGYIAGATVFFDSNGNSVLDAGELSTVTDANGAFTFETSGSGLLVAFGGVNIDTGLANEMTLSAPDGSSVVNPLTSLVASVMAQSGGTLDAAAAEAQVKAALGLNPAIDLLTTDLIAGAADGDAAALAAQKAAVIVVTILSAADDLAADGEGQGAALGTLAALIAGAAGATVDITDAAIIGAMLSAAAPGTDVAATAAQLAASAETITEAESLGDIADAQSDALLTGNGFDNDLKGGARDDEMSGLGGDDSLAGEGGNDVLDGGTGNDSLAGGAGDDVLRGGDGADLLDGGDGVDTADYSDMPAFSFLKIGVVVGLDGSASRWNAGGDTLLNIENVRGSAYRDLLSGNAVANTLWGGDGEDLLSGADGDDSLFGEGGSDLLIGGAGFDRLSGGGSADLFSFGAIGDISQRQDGQWIGRDEILDFEAGTASGAIDRIDLSGIDAKTTSRGDDAFKFIGSKAFSGRAGELHLVDQGVSSDGFRVGLIEGDVNGDGLADFSILVHYQGVIGTSDFIL